MSHSTEIVECLKVFFTINDEYNVIMQWGEIDPIWNLGILEIIVEDYALKHDNMLVQHC